jgi:hypothetical protein
MVVKPTISWTLLHAFAIVFVLINLATGLRIATLSRPWLLELSALLPQGALHWLHIAGGFGLSTSAMAYVIYRFNQRSQRAPGTQVTTETTETLTEKYHRIITWLAYPLVVLSLLTGWLKFFDSALSVVDIHFYAALGFLLYLLLHAGGYFIQYGWPALKRAFVPSIADLKPSWIIVLPAIAGLLLWYSVGYQPSSDLPVKRIPLTTLMTIDGITNEPEWNEAQQITVLTRGGANFTNGETPVTIKVLENGTEAFFNITWQDTSKSLEHLPLIKTARGWQVKQNSFNQFDETAYYEDKLAVMLADQCAPGGGGTAHLGPKPLADQPANFHGKGYHFSDDGKVRDVWHWKAVRTNNMHLADDNFFGPPVTPSTGERRYTAGYIADGKESGAYVMNWQWYKPEVIVPKRLPKNDQLIAPYQVDHQADNLQWVISWFDYTPYRAENDHYPIGTVMPSVMYRSNRFEGDRAHVRAHGQWKDGMWTLELARPLNTQSQHDVILQTGTCLWVSAFDHSQVAHTRHQKAIRLLFERQRDESDHD